MHAMALPSLWHVRGRPGNALDNAGLPRCTHPDNNSASRLLERLGESGATHDSQSASRSGVEAWVARNLNGWDDSDAGLSEA